MGTGRAWTSANWEQELTLNSSFTPMSLYRDRAVFDLSGQ
jgi:hypothetical protein